MTPDPSPEPAPADWPRIVAGDVESAARVLLYAEQHAQALDPVSADWPWLDLPTGYLVQQAALRQRQERGEMLVGVKLGLTSRAKQIRMGIAAPSLAWLTDAMVLPAGRPVPRRRLIHPRAEPEIVFVMGTRLCGPGITAPTAAAAVASVWAGIEVIDSRYRDFSFTLPDAVADNSSSALFTTGSKGVSPESLDLALEACELEADGAVVDGATGAAVLGHPFEALAHGANELGRRGLALEAGWIVLTGGMTDAIPLAAGADVTARFTTLGSVTVRGEC